MKAFVIIIVFLCFLHDTEEEEGGGVFKKSHDFIYECSLSSIAKTDQF